MTRERGREREGGREKRESERETEREREREIMTEREREREERERERERREREFFQPLKTRNTHYCHTVFDCPTPPSFLRKVKSKVGLTRPQPHMTRYKVQIIDRFTPTLYRLCQTGGVLGGRGCQTGDEECGG